MEKIEFNPIQKRCKIKYKLLDMLISEGLNVSQAQSIFEECAENTMHMYKMYYFYLQDFYQQENRD